MTINEILQQGSGPSLNNVEVTKVYPKKNPKGALFLLIKDNSGSGALKLWNQAGNGIYREGDIITVQPNSPEGSVTRTEYNGKVSIDANGCSVTVAGDNIPGNPTQDTPAPNTAFTAQSEHTSEEKKQVLNDMECAFQAFTVCNHVLHFAHKAGWPEDKAFDLAIAAMDSPSKLWFGQKYPEVSTDGFAINNPYSA